MECLFCGKEIDTTNKRITEKTKFCSRECYNEYKRKFGYHTTRFKCAETCPVCGKIFLRNRGKIQATCSKRCGAILSSRKRTGCKQHNKNVKKNWVDKNRPFTNETVDIVRMWYKKGTPSEVIAKILERPVEVIIQIISGEINNESDRIKFIPNGGGNSGK